MCTLIVKRGIILNKRSKIYILVLIWVAALIQLFINASIDRERKMVEQVMSEGVYNLSESVVKAYAFYGNDVLSASGKELIVERLAGELGVTSGYEVTHKVSGTNETTMLKKEGQKGNTEIKLITLSGEDEYGQNINENYILTQITLKQESGTAAYSFKEKMVELYENLGMEASTNIYMCSQLKGKLTEQEKQNYTEAFLTDMDAKQVSVDEFSNVTCVYGYSRNIDEFVYQGDNRVNVNIAFSYDEKEDITYVHRAVPFVDKSF